MFRFRVEGAERVPERGPAVVVAPHRSWLDPACVGGACRRPIRFLIMEAVHSKFWTRWFYRGMGTIPVSRLREARRVEANCSSGFVVLQ